MSQIDPAELERILAALPPADALFLSVALERPWQVARRRQAMRNAALRQAALLLPEGPPTRIAKSLDRHLRRYAGTAWRRGRAPTDPLASALHQALELDGGCPLGWRRIHDLLQNSSMETATVDPDAATHARSPASNPAARTTAARIRDAALGGAG